MCAQISGMLKDNNDTSFTVTNFNYDGQARRTCLALLGCTCAGGRIAHGGRNLCACHPCALAYRVQTFDWASMHRVGAGSALVGDKGPDAERSAVRACPTKGDLPVRAGRPPLRSRPSPTLASSLLASPLLNT